MHTNHSRDFMRCCCEDEIPQDHRCKCGVIILDPFALACEHCELRYEEQPLERLGDVYLTPETAAEVRAEMEAA